MSLEKIFSQRNVSLEGKENVFSPADFATRIRLLSSLENWDDYGLQWHREFPLLCAVAGVKRQRSLIYRSLTPANFGAFNAREKPQVESLLADPHSLQQDENSRSLQS
jgi:hypothetical protein